MKNFKQYRSMHNFMNFCLAAVLATNLTGCFSSSFQASSNCAKSEKSLTATESSEEADISEYSGQITYGKDMKNEEAVEYDMVTFAQAELEEFYSSDYITKDINVYFVNCQFQISPEDFLKLVSQYKVIVKDCTLALGERKMIYADIMNSKEILLACYIAQIAPGFFLENTDLTNSLLGIEDFIKGNFENNDNPKNLIKI